MSLPLEETKKNSSMIFSIFKLIETKKNSFMIFIPVFLLFKQQFKCLLTEWVKSSVFSTSSSSFSPLCAIVSKMKIVLYYKKIIQHMTDKKMWKLVNNHKHHSVDWSFSLLPILLTIIPFSSSISSCIFCILLELPFVKWRCNG